MSNGPGTTIDDTSYHLKTMGHHIFCPPHQILDDGTRGGILALIKGLANVKAYEND